MTSLIEGKYEIIAKLKEGGMGAIYKVRHVLLDEVRVIKVMRPQVEDDPDAQRRFHQEARLATSLKHPNIAALLDFAEDKDHTFYMVMEFIDGANLAEFSARSGPPPLPVALDIGVQSLQALGYLHRRGIIHRDVSPENIMLTHDAEGGVVVKLIDLGVAKQAGSHGMTVTGMFVGKLKYGSPEQLGVLKGDEKIDGRSDIYSFGCVLYQILTGQSAFAAESMQAYVMAHLMHPPRPFEESDPEGKIPEDVREAVLKALAKNRDERWNTAEEFAAALAAALDRMRATGNEQTAEMADLMRVAAQRSVVQQKPSGISEAEARLARAFATPTPTPARESTPRPTPVPARDVTPRPAAVPGKGPSDTFAPTARTVVPPARRAVEPAPTPPPAIPAAVPPVPIPVPVPAPVVPAARNVRLWATIGTAVAAAVLLGLFLLRGRGSTTPPAVPVATATGTVLLTAEPWAHVEKVVDQSGKELAVGDVVTPARLALPSGTFTLTLRSDEPGRETEAKVTVTAGAEVSLHAVIPGFDLEKAVASYVR